MKLSLRFLPALLAATIAFASASRAETAERIVAYVPNWIDLPRFAETIDYAKVTHLAVAFENPTDDGALSFHAGDGALLTKAHQHGVKVLVSIGGGSAASDKKLLARYAKLLSREKRASFVASIADYLALHPFDGIDVDLEGPAIDKNYGAFIAGLSAALKPHGKLLTAALSQGYGGDKAPDSVFASFDFVNIMAYDATGPWNPKKPGQHSSFEFAKATTNYWLERGLPREKAVLGVPFYGYGFGSAFQKGEYRYAAIVEAHPGAENADQAGETIFYNGLPTIRAKAAWVKQQKLGGMMIWSLDSDAPGERSLLRAIDATLRGTQSATR